MVREILSNTTIRLETPIGHIVPRDATYTAFAHATPQGAIGWSKNLGFYWRLDFGKEVTRRASNTDVRKKDRIPLDALKMAALTINMAAAIATCAHDGQDLSDHPVLCNACDGLSASDWLNFKCKTSLIGRMVGRFFIGLLMGTSLGMQAQGDPSLVQLELDKMGARSFHCLHAPDSLTNCPHLKLCRLFQP